MKIPQKTLERKLFQSGYRHVFGVDEVGMGCLAGPVVVCAVSFSPIFFKRTHRKLHWLRDSKLLAPHQREAYCRQLLEEKHIAYQISYCYPKTIDRMNIYQAARHAMRRAIKKLAKQNTRGKSMVLVDGNTLITGLTIEQRAVINGDRNIFAIACASIIAKVYRDRMMGRYAKKYPQYGFEKHKGYGTKLHRQMIREHGPSLIHRKSFILN